MTTSNRNPEWLQKAFFGLHYDLHARATDTELGAELAAAHLRRELLKVKPDWIQCDCKGHPGYTSYPTKVGTPSPGIVRDALRIHRDVTRELGIPLLVHYSGIWDSVAIAQHPEWSVVGADGKAVSMRSEHQYDLACPRGPYVDELMIPQLLELIDEYDVDGFWIDGDNWAVRDCYCRRCRAAFAERTGIAEPPADEQHPQWSLWRAFQRDGFVEYVNRYSRAVHERKPECAVCSNWMYSMRQPGVVKAEVDFLSGDFTASFGCERAEMEGRYLDSHGMPWNLMAWSFCSTEPKQPHQSKTVVHLCQEAAEVMSCGGAYQIYDQPQRNGWLVGWHQDMFAEVAQFCRARQKYSQGTVSVPESAVFWSDSHVWQHNPMPFCLGDSFHPAEGALHALVENQFHVDILDEHRLEQKGEQYALIVVAEQDPITAKAVEILENYARGGMVVLLTGHHLARDYGRLLGVEAAGPVQNSPWHLPVHGEAATLSAPWQPVRCLQAEAKLPVLTQQQPGKDETEFAAVTVRKVGKGKIVGIHGDFMRNYYLSHHPRLRILCRDLLAELGIQRKLHITGPPNLEVALRRRDDNLFLHLVNRGVNPALTPRLHIVEEVPPIHGVDIAIRLETDMEPHQVALEPLGQELAWSVEGDWLKTHVDKVHIHEIVHVRVG